MISLNWWSSIVAVSALLWSAPLPAAGLFAAKTDPSAPQADASRAAPLLRAVVYRPSQTSELLILQPVYHGPAEEFCWVIPLPSRPALRNIFFGSQEFVDAVFERTAPQVRTEIIDPSAPTSHDAQATPALTPWAAVVRSADRLHLGNYGLRIMAPRSGSQIARWLHRAGFAVPDGLEAMADDYLRDDWSFLMVKAYPRVADGKQVTKYLRPLCIRFGTDTPVLPLAVSRLGTAKAITLQLVVVAERPVACREIQHKDLTRRATLGARISYESYRDRLARVGVLREAVVRGACSYSDLSYDARRWWGVRNPPWSRLWATRFFGTIPISQTQDLTFIPDDDVQPFRVHIARTHTLPSRARQTALSARDRLIVLVVLLLMAGGTMWGLGLSADQRDDLRGKTRAMPAFSFGARVAIYTGGLMLLGPAIMALSRSIHLTRPLRQFMSGQLSLTDTVAWAAILVVWAVSTMHFVARSLRQSDESKWDFWLVASALWLPLMATAVFWPSAPMHEAARSGSTECIGVAQLAAMFAISGLAVLLAQVAHAAAKGPQRAQLTSAEFGLLLAVTILAYPFVQGGSYAVPQAVLAHEERTEALASGLHQLRAALADYAAEHGALPASLSALTPVRSQSHPHDVPRPGAIAEDDDGLTELPRDPLTGSTTTWIYHRLMPGLVSSGGFVSELGPLEQDAATSPPMTNYWQLPQPSGLRGALGPVAGMIWGEGDALLTTDTAQNGDTIARAVTIRRLCGSVVRVRQVAGANGVVLATTPGGTGLLLSCVVKPGVTGALEAGDQSEYTAVFEVAGAGHQLAPVGQPIEGRCARLQPSPDGVQIACIVAAPGGAPGRRLWAIDPSGKWQGPLASDIVQVVWHPSATYMLALTCHEGTAPARSKSRRCELVRVWPDGRTDPLAAGLTFTGELLATGLGSAYAVTSDGTLTQVPLRKGHPRALPTPGGQVTDIHCLSGDGLAALVRGAASAGAQARGSVLIFDRKGKLSKTLSPAAPPGVRWQDGKIIGRHDGTGYVFLHLYDKDPVGGVIALVGEDGAPAQEVPVRRR